MRYVLLLQGERASAFAAGRGEFKAPVVFDNNQTGRAKFILYLQERYGSFFTIVLDSKDEEHHPGSVPKLRRADRDPMLNKLKRRYFTEDSLSVVTIEGPSAVGAKSIPVTISGIAAESDCDHWLKILKQTSTLITAMHSVPLLGLAIHNARGGGTGFCIVQLGQNDFRLMAYRNSCLLICRHLTMTANLADELLEQLKETQNYLNHEPATASVDPAEENTPADSDPTGSQSTWSLESAWVVGGLSAQCKSLLENNGIKVASCRSTAKLLGLKREMTSPFADTLFVELALQGKSRKRGFSMGVYRNSAMARRTRHALFAGCICCFGITAVATAAAVRVNQSYSALSNAVEISGNVVGNDAVPGNDSQIPVDAIRESMQIARYLDSKTRFTPRHFLYSFARDLTVYPELEVTAIHWSRIYESNFKNIPASFSIPGEGDGETAVPQAVYYNATINGYLQTQGTERIASLGRFNSFIANLNTTGRYSSVTVIEAPFGVGDDAVTIGGGLARDKENFVIELDVRQEER